MVEGIEKKVCEDIARRQELGINKYGQSVADNPLSLVEWLNHAYEECLDQAVYLARTMDELTKIMSNDAMKSVDINKIVETITEAFNK